MSWRCQQVRCFLLNQQGEVLCRTCLDMSWCVYAATGIKTVSTVVSIHRDGTDKPPYGNCSSNQIRGAALGRRVVGYDMNPTNLEKVRSVALEHTDIDASDLQFHHSDGCVMEELADQQDCFDLITFDPPYAQGAERYTDDPRDLCNVRNLDAFYERLRECMCNCKRLIKKSD